MKKRLIRGLVLGSVGMMVLAFGAANAAVSVTIDNADGSTIYSLPVLPADLAYPSELGLNTQVTGKAGFGSVNGSVLYQFSSVDSVDGETVINYSGDAELACNESGSACTWGFTVPWFMPPGDYKITVTASEPNEVCVSDPPVCIIETDSVTTSIDVSLI